jgi:hypothetical protein
MEKKLTVIVTEVETKENDAQVVVSDSDTAASSLETKEKASAASPETEAAEGNTEKKETSEEDEKDKEKKKQEEAELREKYKDWPLKNIEEPHDNDVLYGRGGKFSLIFSLLGASVPALTHCCNFFRNPQEEQITIWETSCTVKW